MHRRWIKAAVWGFLLWSASARLAGAAGWAESLFAEKGYDFGPIPRGAKVRHNFVLTNRLNEPVSILDVRASCGCTTGKANASRLAPGQSAVIEAEMDTRNFVGPKATTLFVTLVTAQGQESEARLGVSSNILSDVVLNPGTIDFGTVTRGQTPSQVLTIDRINAPNWRAERMVSASHSINATLVETARNGSAVSYSLTVALKPDAPAGTLRDEIRVLTNDAETAAIPIVVTAQIRGELTVKPSLLPLGTVNSAGGAQGRFLVMSPRPFAIQAVEGAGEGFSVEPIDAGKKTLHVVAVSYRPEEGQAVGDLKHTFRVVTDLPGEAPAEVTVTLHVEP